ncbi:hypothetical protein GEMRC1_004639 [Eukaryota sp. GEM-RC1]
MKENNLVTSESNGNSLQHLRLLSLPVYLSGSLNVSDDSFSFLTETYLDGVMSVSSPVETYFQSLFLGASECSTLVLDSDIFVEALFWYCGVIEGVGELKVGTLVFCASNPELRLSRITIEKNLSSIFEVELNLTSDLDLTIDGIIEVAQLSLYSELNITLTVRGDCQLIDTIMVVHEHVESSLIANMRLDHNSEIKFVSTSTDLNYIHPLFLFYDWSQSSSLNDLSGNGNDVLKDSVAEWDPAGFYHFENASNILNIPVHPANFEWRSTTISFLIWFDSSPINRFGIDSIGCRIVFGDVFAYGAQEFSTFNLPRNQWINVVMTTTSGQAKFYIGGELIVKMYLDRNCKYPFNFFPLGGLYSFSSLTQQWDVSAFTSFRGKIRKLFILNRALSESEISSDFTLPPSIRGDGTIKLKNSAFLLLNYSSISISNFILDSAVLYLYNNIYLYDQGIYAFNESKIIISNSSDHIYFEKSHIFLDNSNFVHSAVELHLHSLSLTNTVFVVPSVTERLTIHALFVYSNSTFDSPIICSLSQLHWIDGKLTFLDVLDFKGLFLYGDSKTWPLDSLTIDSILHFNNTLSLSISQLSLITVFATCTPGSEMSIQSPPQNDSLLEIVHQLHLSSNCWLTCHLPVKSTGTVSVANNSVLGLLEEVVSFHSFFISFNGELILGKSYLAVQNAFSFLHSNANAFLYSNWIPNTGFSDLFDNSDSSAIKVAGPEWKMDSSGGYLEVKFGDTLDIPNPLGEEGWTSASIALWVWLEHGGFGFDSDSDSCRFYILTDRVIWGDTFHVVDFPLAQWFYLVMTFNQTTAHIYLDDVLVTSFTPDIPYFFAGSNHHFQGKIRLVQVFSKALSLPEIFDLDWNPPLGIFGQGKLSLVDSDLELLSSSFDLRTIILSSSILQLIDVTFNHLDALNLYRDSIMMFSHNSTVLSKKIFINLNSSELYFDDTIDLSSTKLSLFAINSRFQNDLAVSGIDVLDLSLSTFESDFDTEVHVNSFECSHCELLGNTLFEIFLVSEINSGNFSSSIVVKETVINSTVSGLVQLSNTFDFFSHVIFADVIFSDFQFFNGSGICTHSDVVLNNNVTFSVIPFRPNSDVFLSETYVILNHVFELSDFQMLIGNGVVFDNTSHSGQLIPLPLIGFNDNLVLSSSSNISLKIFNDNSSTMERWKWNSELITSRDQKRYLFIESSQLCGQFTSVLSTCSSILQVLYSSTSVHGILNDYIPDLNQVAYVSTTGIDDVCCGTSDSPCATLSGVLERMGRKGKVYFHEGNYSLDDGLGKFNRIDWQLVGLGDVILDTISTLFEIVHSNVSISNVTIVCNSLTCISLSDSTFQFRDSMIFHKGSASTIDVRSSILFISSVCLDSNSSSAIMSSNSDLFLLNVSISGFFQDSCLILETTQADIAYGNFSNIQSDTLFRLTRSDVWLIDSYCSHSNLFALFHLMDNSNINPQELEFESIRTDIVFVLKSITLDLQDYSVPSHIKFDRLLSAESSDILLNRFSLVDLYSLKSVFFVSESKVFLQNNIIQSVICKSLIESVNSQIELGTMLVSNVSCNTCFELTGGEIIVKFLDIIQSSGTVFGLFDVEILSLDMLTIYDCHMLTCIMTQTTTLDVSNVTVVNTSFDRFFSLKESFGVCKNLTFSNSTFNDVFSLSDTDVSFIHFWFLHTYVSRVFNVLTSDVLVNHFTLDDVMISMSFFSSTDTILKIENLSCFNISLDNSSGLFHLTEGSLL